MVLFTGLMQPTGFLKPQVSSGPRAKAASCVMCCQKMSSQTSGHQRSNCRESAQCAGTRLSSDNLVMSNECKSTCCAGDKKQVLHAVAACVSLVAPSGAASASTSQRAAESLAESMAAEGIVPVDPANYVPSPVEVGWEIWFGAFAGAFPFAIGLYEFTKRIMIQRRCESCGGTGLVTMGERQLECGGFFPWRSWSEFLSANARPGNGGVLRFPKGQTSVFYTVPDKVQPGKGKGSPSEPKEEDKAQESVASTQKTTED